MNTNKFIYADCDETTVQWAPLFQSWIEAKGYHTTGILRETHSVENLIGVDSDEADRLVYEFNMSGALQFQIPEPDALEVLPALYRDGWQFAAITACGAASRLRNQRKDTLEAIFGFPWEVYTVDLHASKLDFLKSFEPAIWVEDNKKHAEDGASIGHRSFLIDRHYNQGNSVNVERVSDWHEIARAIG